MNKRGRKPRAINVVKLTEKERDTFTKKHHCHRCHKFYVDTKEELDYHLESLHGEYSLKKHQEAKGIDKRIHKIYLTRNIFKSKPPEETLNVKLQPTDCFLCWCRNCEKPVAIHMDLGTELQDDLVCPNCRADVFMDNRDEIVGYMIAKGKTPVQFKYETGIDTALFKGYEEKELKLKAKGVTLGEFVNRRNGKK